MLVFHPLPSIEPVKVPAEAHWNYGTCKCIAALAILASVGIPVRRRRDARPGCLSTQYLVWLPLHVLVELALARIRRCHLLKHKCRLLLNPVGSSNTG